MAYTGEFSSDPVRTTSHYDLDFETVTPYRYKIRLDDSDIEAKATATPLADYNRFTFSAATNAHPASAHGAAAEYSLGQRVGGRSTFHVALIDRDRFQGMTTVPSSVRSVP